MGNLGMYQVLTKTAKMMGGPGYLILGIGTAGYLVIRGIEAGTKGIVKEVKRRKDAGKDEVGTRYTVNKEYRDDHGLRLRKGDRVRVIETDGDSYLIEKAGDDNNPYFISGELLKTLVTPV